MEPNITKEDVQRIVKSLEDIAESLKWVARALGDANQREMNRDQHASMRPIN